MQKYQCKVMAKLRLCYPYINSFKCLLSKAYTKKLLFPRQKKELKKKSKIMLLKLVRIGQ